MYLRLLVFICVAVARCGGTQDVFVNQIESSFDAMKLAMLSKVQTGFKPENLKKYSSRLLDTTYSKTGFVYLNVYLDYSTGSVSNCSTSAAVAITSGVSVNYCKQESSYYYKYQVTQDSCEGAVVEYFDDADCLNPIGTSDLGVYVDSCEPVYDTTRFDRVVHQGLRCTSASTPAVPTSAFVRNYYVGTNCAKPVVAYDAYAAMTCLSFRSSQKVYIDCTDSEAPVADIHGSSCDEEPTSTTALSIDCSNNLEDDDHYLSPYLDGPSAQAAQAAGALRAAPTGPAAASDAADPNAPMSAIDTSQTNQANMRLASRNVGTLVAESVSARGICKVNIEKHEKTLSKGALAGIIIGVIAGVALLVAYMYYKIFKEDYEPVSLRPGTEMNFLSPHPTSHHTLNHAPQGTQQPQHAAPPRTRPPLQRSAVPLSDTNSIWSRQAQNTQQDDVSVISDSLWSQKTNNTHTNPLSNKAVRKEPGALSTKV